MVTKLRESFTKSGSFESIGAYPEFKIYRYEAGVVFNYLSVRNQ